MISKHRNGRSARRGVLAMGGSGGRARGAPPIRHDLLADHYISDYDYDSVTLHTLQVPYYDTDESMLTYSLLIRFKLYYKLLKRIMQGRAEPFECFCFFFVVCRIQVKQKNMSF